MWSAEEVGVWLKSIELGEYAKKFIDNAISGMELLELEEEDVISLGIKALAHRKRILSKIKELNKSTCSTIGKKKSSSSEDSNDNSISILLSTSQSSSSSSSLSSVDIVSQNHGNHNQVKRGCFFFLKFRFLYFCNLLFYLCIINIIVHKKKITRHHFRRNVTINNFTSFL